MGTYEVSVIQLDSQLGSAMVIGTITDDVFRVPATIAEFGSSIYAINARYDVGLPPFLGGPAPDPDLEYEVVEVAKH